MLVYQRVILKYLEALGESSAPIPLNGRPWQAAMTCYE